MTILAMIGWAFTAAVVFMMAKGGTEKVLGSDEMVGNFAFMKLEKYRVFTGFGEIIGAILLMFPITSLYGMVLITSFMSAAVVLHLSLMNGAKTQIPIAIGIGTILSYLLRTL